MLTVVLEQGTADPDRALTVAQLVWVPPFEIKHRFGVNSASLAQPSSLKMLELSRVDKVYETSNWITGYCDLDEPEPP